MTLIQIKVPEDYTPEQKREITRRAWRRLKAGCIVQLRMSNNKTMSYA